MSARRPAAATVGIGFVLLAGVLLWLQWRIIMAAPTNSRHGIVSAHEVRCGRPWRFDDHDRVLRCVCGNDHAWIDGVTRADVELHTSFNLWCYKLRRPYYRISRVFGDEGGVALLLGLPAALVVLGFVILVVGGTRGSR